MQKTSLPIDPHLADISALLEKHSRLIIQATPGSGKTTRVAPYLLDHLIHDDKTEVWVLEPRRLAARMAANRVAFERGQKVGEEIGYQFRWEKFVGPRTRIRFLTEGTLVRLLLKEPSLKNVGIVILDEFHERHLQGDQALALLLQLQRTTRPDLKLVLMSATLEADFFKKVLDCPVSTVEGRLHPVHIDYFIPPTDARLEDTIARVIRDQWRARGTDCGDFLVFLPGMSEILRTQSVLAPMVASMGGFVSILHGEMDADLQKNAIESGRGKKIILSTNIAESSVTIEGIRVVIDSGLHRVYSEDIVTGMPSLRTQKTSKSSCIQRANRAGRVQEGHCVRLYSESDFHGRPEADLPEILRTDLSHTLLEIRALGFDEKTLPWPSKVPSERWQHSENLLEMLGALVSTQGGLSPIGERMSELPLSPRLSRFLIEAERVDILEPAVEVAVLLSEGKLPGVDLLELAQQKQAPQRTRDRLRSFFKSKPVPLPSDFTERLARCLLYAYPDRVAQRRRPFGKTVETFVLSESGSASMPIHPVLGEKEYFTIPAIQKSVTGRAPSSAAKILGICPIEAEWLLDIPGGAVENEAHAWDEKARRLKYRSELRYGAIVLESQEKTPDPDLKTSEEFCQSALGINKDVLSTITIQEWLEKIRARTDVTELEQASARLAFWLKFHPQHLTPTFWSDRFLDALTGVFSLDALREVDWMNRLPPPAKADELQRFAPATLQFSTKRRAKIFYSFDKDPWVESRLQDFFGMTTSPTVGGGQVSLTLHLMAPNQRAVQVTRDLVSFWKNTYPELRKNLSRRYPRHAWPEDPSQPE